MLSPYVYYQEFIIKTLTCKYVKYSTACLMLCHLPVCLTSIYLYVVMRGHKKTFAVYAFMQMSV